VPDMIEYPTIAPRLGTCPVSLWGIWISEIAPRRHTILKVMSAGRPCAPYLVTRSTRKRLRQLARHILLIDEAAHFRISSVFQIEKWPEPPAGAAFVFERLGKIGFVLADPARDTSHGRPARSVRLMQGLCRKSL